MQITQVHCWSIKLAILVESTPCPPKIVIIKTRILHLTSLVHVDITFWIIFVHFKYIALALDLNYFFLKTSNKHLQTWTYEIYLCWINMLQSMKNWKYTSKLRLWMEFCSECFFVVNDIDIHQLNLKPFRSLKLWLKIH
jgi:hypothetical protein